MKFLDDPFSFHQQLLIKIILELLLLFFHEILNLPNFFREKYAEELFELLPCLLCGEIMQRIIDFFLKLLTLSKNFEEVFLFFRLKDQERILNFILL